MGKIILVGIVHIDKKGRERLEDTLNSVSPDALAIEYSKRTEDYSRKIAEELENTINKLKRAGLSKSIMDFFIASCGKELFEVNVPQEYSVANNIPLYLIDDPSLADTNADVLIRSFRDKISKIIKNKDKLNQTFIIPTLEKEIVSIDAEYHFAIDALGGAISDRAIDEFLNPLREHFIGKRDEYMEKRIRKILAEKQYERFTCVLGYAHLLDDPRKETLYSRIKDMHLERKLIYRLENEAWR